MGPGAFDELGRRLKPHAGKLAVLGVLVVLAAAALATWRWYTRNQAGKATWELAKVTDEMAAPIRPADAPPAEPGDDQPTFPSAKARAEAALAQLTAFEKTGSASEVGDRALLLKGALLYDLGRWDEAVEAYDRFLAKRPPAALAYVAHEGKGYAREAQALAAKDDKTKQDQLGAALAAFADIQSDPQGPFYANAAYHQARVAAELGKDAQAIDLYKKALAAKPGFQLEEQIKERLARLEQKGGAPAMPKPVPAK